MQDVHGVKQQTVKCPQCSQLFTDKSMFRNHVKGHQKDKQMFEFYCEVCQIKFKQLEDAKNHNLQPCGNIKKAHMVNNIQEQSSLAKDSEEIITLTKETATNKCNACNKVFKTNTNLESHIEAKHSEKKCIYCDLVCDSEDDLVEHHKECNDIGTANKTCNKCSNVFTKQGLQRHQTSCQENKKTFDCYECGELFPSSIYLKNHKEDTHKMEPVRSRVICKHWKKGICNKGDSCGFSHAGHQNINQTSSTRRIITKLPSCRNGSSCDWLKRGKCNFFHAQARDHGDRQERHLQGGQKGGQAQGGRHENRDQGGRQETRGQQSRAQGGRQPDRDQCKFDGRCERIPNCPYIHSLEDFPILQGGKQPVRRIPNNQRKN